tara:strand:- start:377 stop:1015 length:639 start_codon:yes stop_codon:yes gene_type:complete
MKTLLLAATALLLTACSSSDKKRPKPVLELIQGIDLSGTLHHLGGMLINDKQLIHVTHWPTKEGQKVFFVGKDKLRVYRNIAKIEDLGIDLCVITLDKPVNLNNHTIYPVAKPIIGAQTTVLRFESRPRRATTVQSYSAKGRAKLALTPSSYLVGGDSGKAWIQIQDGKKVCVGLNSTTWGFGPPVWDLLLKWVNNKEIEMLAPVIVEATRL